MLSIPKSHPNDENYNYDHDITKNIHRYIYKHTKKDSLESFEGYEDQTTEEHDEA